MLPTQTMVFNSYPLSQIRGSLTYNRSLRIPRPQDSYSQKGGRRKPYGNSSAGDADTTWPTAPRLEPSPHFTDLAQIAKDLQEN